MKIKMAEMDYEKAMAQPHGKSFKPKKPNMLFRTLLKVVSAPELMAVDFKCNKIGMEKLGKREPALFLMNHSSFIDLKIASSILYPRPFNIVCTFDGFVGKNWLMRQLGCVPTNKFVFDLTLVRNIRHCLKKLKSSVLMYPEAGYSFDGTSTTLPKNLGKFVKMMGVPVVMITTYGAFARDPLYNNLQKRKVSVSADMEYFISPEQAKSLSEDELQGMIEEKFTFDGFAWQSENDVKITESFRADGLNRVLYKCPECLSEGTMLGSGTKLVCRKCGCEHELTELGRLKSGDKARFSHIPDWYKWQRQCVKEEIESGSYHTEMDVDICILINTKRLYKVGRGKLTHSSEGFKLVGCGGLLRYTQKPPASYSLNSDFFWYELGDVISIGNRDVLFYCFPRAKEDIVTKVRLATEEIFKKLDEAKSSEKATV